MHPSDMTDAQLQDLFFSTPTSDPEYAVIEAEMLRRGLLCRA